MARATYTSRATPGSLERWRRMRALLSVDDKTGLIPLARGLQEGGWERVATDGTRAALAAEGVTARSVEDITGSPTLLDGRVKTLHPKIHGAIPALWST